MERKVTLFNRVKKTLLISCSLLWMVTNPSFAQTRGLNVVKTNSGMVAGVHTGHHDVLVFKGIPFAAPPVGDLRWKAPQPAKPWKGVRPCNTYGPNPMQYKPVPFGVYSQEFLIPKKGRISEDCLYLNVWTGAKSPKEKRPVMVWIYGGGFVVGSGSVPIYNGMALAEKGVVFVTINYRVGCFGFFVHPALTKESGHQASGNYALMDQIAALQWVQKNIAAFGGDPSNVTIEGQSAGSVSVNCLIASPQAKGLFKRAIAESGGCMLDNNMISLHQAEQEGVKIAQSLHARTLADLRHIPAEDILRKVNDLRSPVIDGYILPDTVGHIFAEGKQNDVDLLTGWNGDEKAGGKPETAAAFRLRIQKRYGDAAEQFFRFYPAANAQEATESQAAFGRDSWAGMESYVMANRQAKTGRGKIYLYNFVHKLPARGDTVKYGAFHSGEIVYALNNLAYLYRPWQQVDFKLADQMSDYWVNFARTGNPNGAGLAAWPEYTPDSSMVMVFDHGPLAKALPSKEALMFLYDHLEK